MGSVYERKDSPYLWLQWRSAAGEKRNKPTRFLKGDPAHRREAERALEIIVQQDENIRRTGSERPLTVRRWAEQWVAERREDGLSAADDDETRLRLHVLPRLGELLLSDVRPLEIRRLFLDLRRRGGLAPRTILNVYGALRTMFEDAVSEDVIPSNPCRLRRRKRRELPAREDKDPAWRAGAIFTRDEVELLISHPDVPLYRRVLWALMFLTGERSGEASARRWRDYDARAEPLGRLVVATSWNSKLKLLKTTKAKKQRHVPVHPLLARLLAQWRLQGWCAEFGRQPTAEDLIVPSHRLGADGQLKYRHSTKTWEQLHTDCATVGIRGRRVHDARRTFISLLQLDGAAPAKVKLISHGPEGSVIGDYTTLPWSDLCAQVSMLKIGLRGAAEVAQLRAAAGGGLPPAEGPGAASYAELRAPATTENDSTPEVPRAGFEPARDGATGPESSRPAGTSATDGTGDDAEPPLARSSPATGLSRAGIAPWELGPCSRPGFGVLGGRP